MSHVTTVSLKIRDLNALKAALAEFGAEWKQDQKTYTWYGQFVGDSPMPAGMTKDMLGKCEHAIRVPGIRYEIGVVKMPDNTYTLAYDFYSDPWSMERHDGGKLLEKFGDGLQRLVQGYAVQVATIKAKASGWMVSRQKLNSGTIKLVLTGM